nr:MULTISPECIES: nuclear transport factor 2 family protein [Bradyrhizobium]
MAAVLKNAGALLRRSLKARPPKAAYATFSHIRLRQGFGGHEGRRKCSGIKGGKKFRPRFACQKSRCLAQCSVLRPDARQNQVRLQQWAQDQGTEDMMTLNRDHAATTDYEAVAKNVEAFRLAQIAADPKALGALCADDLSYSHSSGFLEDKAAFIANATDGKTEFLSITYKDPTIKIVGPAAIVRFHWLAEMMTGGQKVANSLHILMNWLKQGDDWKLLSRSATKL